MLGKRPAFPRGLVQKNLLVFRSARRFSSSVLSRRDDAPAPFSPTQDIDLPLPGFFVPSSEKIFEEISWRRDS